MPQNVSEFDMGRMAQRVEGLEARMNRHETFMVEQLKEVTSDLKASNVLIQRAHGALLFLGVITSGGAIAAVVDLVRGFGGH